MCERLKGSESVARDCDIGGGEFRAKGPFDLSLGHRPRNRDPTQSFPSANGAVHRIR